MEVMGQFTVGGECARCNIRGGGRCSRCDRTFRHDEVREALYHFAEHGWEWLHYTLEEAGGHICDEGSIYFATHLYGTRAYRQRCHPTRRHPKSKLAIRTSAEEAAMRRSSDRLF
jgi:hypothetical protein